MLSNKWTVLCSWYEVCDFDCSYKGTRCGLVWILQQRIITIQGNMDADFAELSNDVDLIARMTQFGNASENIQNFLKLSNDPELYDRLSNSEKIQYNLLMSFSINSLFWMYLRAEGIDPTKHEIKSENDRLKQSMARAKQINDKNTIMPRVNRDVAQRFVRSGLWEAKDKRDKGRRSKD